MTESPIKKVAINGDDHWERFSHLLVENMGSLHGKADSLDRMRIRVKIGID